MIIPATIATAVTPTAIPTMAPAVNPLLSVFPMVGGAVVVPVTMTVPMTILVPVPVLAMDDGKLLELLIEVLPILVENAEGVEFGMVVPIDSLGKTLYCFDAASMGLTPEFGEPNVLTQTLILPKSSAHVS
jgi:hypothetical protein